ncbi:MAG: oligosaccharide flippase family protein [Candidatus Thorarchaeota archaeon]
MSNENNIKTPPLQDNKEYKNLARNTFYSFLMNYGSHFFTFIISFLLARLLTDANWQFLILALSYMAIITIITTLLPPGQEYSLNYYIPRYLALGQKSKIKSLIKNALTLKILFLIPVFIVSIIIFSVFADFFAINLEDKVVLLYLLSPLILTNGLTKILDAINRGFSRFKFLFILLLVKNAFHITPLFLYYFFKIDITVETIALIYMFSYLIPFTLNLLFIINIVYKIKSIKIEKESLKEDLGKVMRYGSFMGFSNIIGRLWKEAQFQGIGFFESSGAVTGYNIAWNYKDIGAYTVHSFNLPLLTSFTSLNTKENYNQIKKIFKVTYKITLFLLLLIVGLLFFSVNFLIDFIFLETRLKYSIFLKLMLIATVFSVLEKFVQNLLNSSNRVKIPFLLKIIEILYAVPLFFIGLIYFGVEGAIILGLILGFILSTIIQIIVTRKIGNIKLNVKKILIQYITFFIPLGITIIFESLIFKKTSFRIIDGLGLSLFKNFDFLSIGTFLILFISMNLVLKTVTSTDIEMFESLLNKDRSIDRILIKGLNILKKFTRKQ